MSFNELSLVKAPVKTHACVWCHTRIVVGEEHQKFVGVWEGEFQNWRVHNDCLKPMTSSDQHEDSGEICSGPHFRGGKCEC